jgi:hypothetical protein
MNIDNLPASAPSGQTKPTQPKLENRFSLSAKIGLSRHWPLRNKSGYSDDVEDYAPPTEAAKNKDPCRVVVGDRRGVAHVRPDDVRDGTDAFALTWY